MGAGRDCCPSFIVIGAARSGTTYLYNLLRSHPNIYLPHLKEPQFFNHRYHLGESWYMSLFDGASVHQETGEASAGYLVHRDAPQRIYQHNPRVKLICVLRHPVYRTWSHYTRIKQTRGERRSFWEARPDNHIRGSRYALHLKRYLRYFTRDQLLLLRSMELYRDPLNSLNRTERFLGVTAREKLPAFRRKRNRSRMPVSHTVQSWLHRELRPAVISMQRGRRNWHDVIRTGVWIVLNELNHIPLARRAPTLDREIGEQILEDLLPDIEELENLLGWNLDEWKRL